MNNNMRLLIHIFVLILLAFQGCNTDSTSQTWYKGNLHTHSYWSDGDDYPEMIMDWYKNHGYHFVALSDHNILAEGEKWKSIPDIEKHRKAYRDYLAEYGPDWVESRIDSTGLQVRLKTLEQYRPLFEVAGEFLLIPAEEITTRFNKIPVHLNAINIQDLIIPRGGSSVAEVLQNNIDAVLAQRDSTGVPILPHINHPNYKYALTVDDFIGLKGERFFEVYNGHPSVNNYGDSLHISTEEMWDAINIAYARKGQPLLYGLATDDSHNYHEFGHGKVNPGRGWVMVNTDSLTARSLIKALEKGWFYSSTGVTLSSIGCSKNILSVVVQPENGVDYEIQFIGAYAGADSTTVVATTTGITAQFELIPALQFIRAKIISSKVKANPHALGEFEVAWGQPVSHQNNN